MIRPLVVSFAALALVTGLAFADPEIVVRYVDGAPLIQLSGSYPQSHYTVYRAAANGGAYIAVTDDQVLCIGDCYALDREAEPGGTYDYRFDLLLADGRFVSYGPYSVTISARLAPRLAVQVSPNPGHGPSRLDLTIAGALDAAPVDAQVTLFDVRGRALRVLHRGPLARGVTKLAWDGRDRDGTELPAGLYFVRLRTAGGSAVTRVLRVR